jgi:hypothetical protein
MRYILILVVFASCSPLYVPNTRNVPLFREQGEAQISTYLTSAGLDFQGAYALTDHVAAIGSYSWGSVKRTNPDYTRKNSYGEIGLGYYDRSRSARYEVFAGYGIGQGTSYDQYYFFGPATVVATGKMQRIFLQPSIGTNNRDFNMAFTPRFAWVNYSEFTDAVKTVKPNEKAQFFIEPAITAKFRLAGNIFGFCQLGMTVPIPSEVFFDYMPMQVAAGFQIDTGGLRTKVY